MKKILFLLLPLLVLLTACDPNFLFQDEYDIPDNIYHDNQLDSFWNATIGMKAALTASQSPELDGYYNLSGSQGGLVYNLANNKVWTVLYKPGQEKPFLTHYGHPGDVAHKVSVVWRKQSNEVLLFFNNLDFVFPEDNRWIFIQAGTKIYKLHPLHQTP